MVEAEMRASAEAAPIAKKARLEEIIQGAKKVTVIGLDGKRMTHYVKKGDVEQNVQETVKAKTGIPVEEQRLRWMITRSSCVGDDVSCDLTLSLLGGGSHIVYYGRLVNPQNTIGGNIHIHIHCIIK